MGLKKGFDAALSSGANNFLTIGDVTYDDNLTDIEVKNRSSQEVRYMPGMRTRSYSFQVQAGTDPEDVAAVDSYEFFKDKYENQETFPLTFMTPGGINVTKNVIVTSFSAKPPVDGLDVADVTIKVSAAGESGSGSGS